MELTNSEIYALQILLANTSIFYLGEKLSLKLGEEKSIEILKILITLNSKLKEASLHVR
jgi:hypothetical protein